MNANDAIILARKHIGNGAAMDSSARLCLTDAVALQDKGDLSAAKVRALKSLGYSVGVFHNDYKRVNQSVMTDAAQAAKVRAGRPSPSSDYLTRIHVGGRDSGE